MIQENRSWLWSNSRWFSQGSVRDRTKDAGWEIRNPERLDTVSFCGVSWSTSQENRRRGLSVRHPRRNRMLQTHLLCVTVIHWRRIDWTLTRGENYVDWNFIVESIKCRKERYFYLLLLFNRRLPLIANFFLLKFFLITFVIYILYLYCVFVLVFSYNLRKKRENLRIN